MVSNGSEDAEKQLSGSSVQGDGGALESTFSDFVNVRSSFADFLSSVDVPFAAAQKGAVMSLPVVAEVLKGARPFDTAARDLLEGALGRRFAGYFYRMQLLENWEKTNGRPHSGRWVRKASGFELSAD